MYPSAGQDQLSYGAGQLNPAKAVDPGLVYDAGASDYVQMLCDSGYNETMIRIVTGDSSSCSSSTSTGTARDLNYPSMALHVQSGKAFAAKFLRTVTNVGSARRGKYKAEVRADRRLNVVVNPSKLRFSELNEKRQFTVSVSGGPLPGNSTASATVIWSDGKHLVVYSYDCLTSSRFSFRLHLPLFCCVSESSVCSFDHCNYQLEVLEKAKKENMIVFLETGSRKTLIAVMYWWRVASFRVGGSQLHCNYHDEESFDRHHRGLFFRASEALLWDHTIVAAGEAGLFLHSLCFPPPSSRSRCCLTEASHAEGLSPELALVTIRGGKELEEKLVVFT
ncbi:hypothetical protein ZIOFF_003702 [Zingiber officinale]|uniref:Subtilisin-like protease fibronectin type-III domain-containing protein n=1 Tax=Zingiber officinale TaxID=94328 RepID=A0A8J5LWV1_ZINOF|nr:hypothetical protein ZIOFF_003702 [Zingiber officinale]